MRKKRWVDEANPAYGPDQDDTYECALRPCWQKKIEIATELILSNTIRVGWVGSTNPASWSLRSEERRVDEANPNYGPGRREIAPDTFFLFTDSAVDHVNRP